MATWRELRGAALRGVAVVPVLVLWAWAKDRDVLIAALSPVALTLFCVYLFARAATRVLAIHRVTSAPLVGYELLLGERVLRVGASGSLAAEVLRPEVAEIVETRQGMWVTCQKPARSAFVIRALDGYVDVREALEAWATIRPVRGFEAIRRARREKGRQGPRDAVGGTALATDASLVAELEGVRAASNEGHGGPVPVGVMRGRKVLALWVALIVLFLAIWQFLSPSERPKGDVECHARPQCKSFGHCTAQGAACAAGSDADCRQSDVCKKLGRCTEVGGVCYVRRGLEQQPEMPWMEEH
jgi:hypothetical protein